jgi:hypothetical protein
MDSVVEPFIEKGFTLNPFSSLLLFSGSCQLQTQSDEAPAYQLSVLAATATDTILSFINENHKHLAHQ